MRIERSSFSYTSFGPPIKLPHRLPNSTFPCSPSSELTEEPKSPQNKKRYLNNFIKNNKEDYFPSKESVHRYHASADLFTVPDCFELCKYSFVKLANVENFEISNKFGKIKFLHPVDLRGVDLGRCVKISNMSIEVYPDYSFFTGINKPIFGKGLNVPALLFFNGMKKEALEKAKIKALNQGLFFISYDENTQVFCVKAFSF
mgnify:CR=1 FL=1